MTTLEREIEEHLIRCVRVLGGQTRKARWDGNNGAPDRLVLLPGGRLAFAELKRPEGGRVSKLQAREHRALRALGFLVAVPRTHADVEALLEEMSCE